VFCDVAAVLKRGFEVSPPSFGCLVDEAIVEMREVRRWRVDGRGFEVAIDFSFSFCPGWDWMILGMDLFLFKLVERAEFFCYAMLLDLGLMKACALGV